MASLSNKERAGKWIISRTWIMFILLILTCLFYTILSLCVCFPPVEVTNREVGKWSTHLAWLLPLLFFSQHLSSLALPQVFVFIYCFHTLPLPRSKKANLVKYFCGPWFWQLFFLFFFSCFQKDKLWKARLSYGSGALIGSGLFWRHKPRPPCVLTICCRCRRESGGVVCLGVISARHCASNLGEAKLGGQRILLRPQRKF